MEGAICRDYFQVSRGQRHFVDRRTLLCLPRARLMGPLTGPVPPSVGPQLAALQRSWARQSCYRRGRLVGHFLVALFLVAL